MPRRKPTSARQKKADIQLKRAIKRGDAPPPDAKPKSHNVRLKRGPNGKPIGPVPDAAAAARRLQSTFISLPPKFLENTKLLASEIPLHRPIPDEMSIFPPGLMGSDDPNAQRLSCPRRPKWRFDMTKKEVEHNEEGLFRKWLEEIDELVLAWQADASEDEDHQEKTPQKTQTMPRSPTYFERNIEVWRQLWRVTEISQILLVLLDSRCPLLHFPPSLATFLSDRKVILVLTKTDICGPERAIAWTNYLNQRYPKLRVILAEAYLPKEESTYHQGRAQYVPHLPQPFRERLVEAIQGVHAEMLLPPDKVKTSPSRLENWNPSVKRDVNWNSLLTADNFTVGEEIGGRSLTNAREAVNDEVRNQDRVEPEFLTIGLIGQPNVGKSSLLNALFGSNRVKASKTPGKTKHFQTLFWTPEVRLVDCPGLVMPNLVPMEMQALCGVLPISRMSAIPSCIHFVSERLPIERIYDLDHPQSLLPPTADKRTWRDDRRLSSVEQKPPIWTAIDLLTAYANRNNWLTAKIGRPDTHRAGNAILRSLAEGRIAWAYWPPGTTRLNIEKQENGIWLPHATKMSHSEESTDDDSHFTEDEALSTDENLSSEFDCGEDNDEGGFIKPERVGGIGFEALAIY